MIGKEPKHEHPQSSSTLTLESFEEGSTNEAIWYLAEQCFDEYDHKLVDLSHQFANLQGEN